MQHSIGLLVCLLALGQDGGLHPAFTKSTSQLKAAWEQGEKDVKKHRDSSPVVNRFRRGIGKIRTSMIESKTVSWLWYFPPEIIAYHYGMLSKRQYWPEEEKRKVYETVVPRTGVQQQALIFHGVINSLPSFGGGWGQIDRYPDPTELEDVRCVLEVGGRIYQPVEQPGNIRQAEGSSTNVVGIPSYSWEHTQLSGTANAHGSGGYVTWNFTDSSTTTRSFTTYHEEDYKWYRGEFLVVFALYGKSGKSVITAKDKEFSVLVIYGANERKATFALKDLTKIF